MGTLTANAARNATKSQAWRLGATDGEYNALVYAETRNAAKAIRADGFEEFEYIEITANREPLADKHYQGQRIEYRSLVLYEIGWWSDEGSPRCEVCERCAFDDVEGSEVCDECYRCTKCGCEDDCFEAAKQDNNK